MYYLFAVVLGCVEIEVCLHLRSPYQSELKIVSMVGNTVMGKMGCTPILLIKVSVKKIKSATHNAAYSDIDDMCKRSLRIST